MPRLPLIVALLAVLSLGVGAADSLARPPREGRHHGVAGGHEISLNQAISMVERRFKARVVRSDVRQDGNRKIYVLRLLDDAGRARVVRVDAATGSIL